MERIYRFVSYCGWPAFRCEDPNRTIFIGPYWTGLEDSDYLPYVKYDVFSLEELEHRIKATINSKYGFRLELK